MSPTKAIIQTSELGFNKPIVFICKRPAISATVSAVVSYHPGTNITTGYILSGDGLPSVIPALDAFPAQFAAYSHPILVFVLILEILVENISSNLNSVEQNLRAIESSTGYSNHKILEPVDPSELNYRTLAQDLGVQTCRFALIRSLIQNATMLREFIEEQLASSCYLAEPSVKEWKPVSERLIERTRITASTLKHLEIYGAVEGRLQAQQNVVSKTTNNFE